MERHVTSLPELYLTLPYRTLLYLIFYFLIVTYRIVPYLTAYSYRLSLNNVKITMNITITIMITITIINYIFRLKKSN